MSTLKSLTLKGKRYDLDYIDDEYDHASLENRFNGKNLLNPEHIRQGDVKPAQNMFFVSLDLPGRVYINAGTTVTLSWDMNFVPMGWLYVTDINNNILEVFNNSGNRLSPATATFTVGGYLGASFGRTTGSWITVTVDEVLAAKPQLEIGPTATPYKPYTNDIYAPLWSSQKILGDITGAMADLDNSGAIVREASGDVISINDSSDRAIKDLKVYGKTTQLTTTGRNLIPYPHEVSTITKYGVTFTDNGDGSVTVKGTATETYQYTLGRFTAIEGQQYAISGITGGASSTYRLWVVSSTAFPLDHRLFAYNTPRTVTAMATEEVTVQIIVYSGATVNEKIYPQIELGSAATAYEPYTGGIPSPNPEYPQDLVSPGSITKNLLDPNSIVQGDYNFTNTSVRVTQAIAGRRKVRVGETYTMSWNNPAILGWLIVTDENNAVVEAPATGIPSPITVTIQNEGYLCPIFGTKVNGNWASLTVAEVIAANIQIERSHTATVYKPYGLCETSVTVAGKNILPTVTSITNLYDKAPTVDNGYIYGGWAFGFRSPTDKECIFSFKMKHTNTTDRSRPAIQMNGVYVFLPPYTNTGEYSVIIPANYTGYVKIDYGSVDVTTRVLYDLQIELGTVATAYEPYKELQTITIPTENGLPGLPLIRNHPNIPISAGINYIDSNGQHWMTDEIDLVKGVYIQHVKQVDWDRFIYRASNENNSIFSTTYYKDYLRMRDTKTVMCSHLPAIADTSSGLNYVLAQGIGVSVYSGADSVMYAVFPKSVVGESKDGLLAYIAAQEANGTPVILYYPSVEPVETPLTADQLAAYKSLHTNKPNTRVYNSGGAQMEFNYTADTKTFIDNKFNELATALVNNA